MLKNKLMLPILAVIVGVAASAFTMPHHKSSANTLYYFEFSGGSYPSVTLPDGTTPPTVPFCTASSLNQCDGGFIQGHINVTENGDGTATWTPIASSVDVTNFKN